MPLFVAYHNTAAAKASINKYSDAAECMLEVSTEEYKDNTKELCHCKFMQMYGTNMLFHNTKVRLLCGKKYGLLDGNVSENNTLLQIIANNSMETFLDANGLPTVFVEVGIPGGSHT